MMSDPVRHGLRLKLLAVLVAACYGSAQANPGSPQVVAGQASFLQQGNLYTITNTPNAIINWQNFSISPNEITRFIQQSGDSKVLNRIVGQDPSKILGSLQSNGKVYLINPNGVLFGKDARIDVNGLVASSLAISNADFLAGKNRFAGDGAGKVVNQGSITTPDGGQVYLIASSVENSGVITSPQGDVVLAAGKSVQLVDSANPDVHVVVSAPSDQALNLGQVLAAGGKVGIYGALVNQRGRVSADSAVLGANGKIVLKSSGTTLLEAGSRTSAVNTAGKGGEIQLLGDRVGLTDDAAVDASGAAGGGTVLIGGDYQGKNAAVMHAQQTYIGAQATVRADATLQGDGGKIVAWSDGATRVFGSLSARGGAQGGDGGMLETSGKYLDMQGKADTRAPKGKTGSLLLDPTDIYIASDAGTAFYGGMIITAPQLAEAAGVFLPSGVFQDSLLLTSTLTTALATTDVSISTTNSDGIGEGMIKVVSPFSWASSQSLTLNAATDIKLNAAVTATGTGSTLALNAGGAITQTAAMSVKNLTANAGGSITLDNSSNVIAGTASISGNGIALNAASLTLGQMASTGALSATAESGDLTANGTIQAPGAITLLAKGAGATLSTAGAASITASGGDTLLKADKMTLGGAIEGGARTVSLLTNSSTTAIALGVDAADSSSTLGLSEAELQKVHLSTNGLLLVGRGAAGVADVTVSGDLNLGSSLGNGGVVLNAANGNLTINSGVTLTAPGIVNLQTNPTGAYTVTNQGTVQAGANSGINLFTGDLALQGGHLNGSWVSIDTVNSIDVGATTSGGIKMAIDAADLAGISTGSLSLSNNSVGGTSSLTISEPLSFSGNLALRGQNASGTSIDIASALDVTGDLTLYAPGTIAATADVTTGGVFTLNTGNWNQVSANLPVFSAHDFRIAGGSFLRATGGDGDSGYMVVDVYGLQGVASFNSLAVALAGNIDASTTANWNSNTGFRPIGSVATPYSHTFDGGGYTVSGLTIYRSGYDNVGLFGSLDGGTIRNLKLSGGSVIGGLNVGGVVGSVTGATSTIQNVHSSAAVTGSGLVGGLVGINGGSITTSSATGSVSSAGEFVGGLVGDNVGGMISQSFASGSVLGGRNVGGLVGRNSTGESASGEITDVYASGTVGAHSAPTVTPDNMGGLVGENLDGTISNAFSSSVINGGDFDHVNGLVGLVGTGTLSRGYFNSVNAGTSADANGGVALTPAQMMQATSFQDFDFAGIGQAPAKWRIYEGYTTPLLKSTLTQLTVTIAGNDVTKVYDGASATFDTTGTTYSVAGATVDGTLGWGGKKNVGSYNVGGLYSTQYDISYQGSSPVLQITKAPLTAQLSGTRVYDGTTSFSGATVALTGLVAGDTVTGSGVGYFSNKDVGTNKTLTDISVTLGGADAGNYQTSASTGSAAITPALLTVTGIAGVERVYDGSTVAAVEGTPVFSAIGNDVVTASVTGSYTFVDKNAGYGKSITAPLALGGTDAGNYQAIATTTGDITKAPVTLSGLTGVNRVYNGSTGASVTGGTLSGVLGSDTVQVGTVHAYFTGEGGKNVGSNKPIGFEGATLTGTDGGNYAVTSYSGSPTANVTPAALTVGGITAQDRVYNGGTVASLSIGEGGQLTGRPEFATSDDVYLNTENATGAFSDRNVGTGKTVTVSGLALAGSDASNYTFTAPTTTASISQLGKATWTGSAGDKLWSNAGNWSGGAVPVASNVLNAELGMYGGEVIYDAGSTTLNSLTGIHIAPLTVKVSGGTLAVGTVSTGNSSMGLTLAGGALTLGLQEGGTSNLGGGALTINSGSLSLGGALTAGSYVQTGGALSGAGTLTTGSFTQTGGTVTSLSALTISSNYTHSGGSIVMPGSVSIHKSTGNLSVGPITALEGISLSVGEGASIGQSGALSTNELTVSSQGGVTLNNSANHVLHFNGTNYGSGGISLYNTLSGSDELGVGPLSTSGGSIVVDNVGGIYTEGTLSAASGAVSLTAHSPITINNTVQGDSVSLSASTGIVLTGSSSIQTVHDISMTAGTGIQLAGILQSTSGGISVLAQTGSISADSGMTISGAGAVTLSATQGSITAPAGIFQGGTAPVINDGAAAAAAKAAADAAAAKAAADAAAKAAADAAAKAAADAAAKAAADAAAKAAADAAAAKAAADAAAKAAADAIAKAAADAAAKAAAEAAAKAAQDALDKAAADAAAKALADAAAAADAAAKAAQEAAAKAAQDAAAKAAQDAAAKAAQDAAAKAAADAAEKAAHDEAAAKAAADAAAKAAAEAAAKAAAEAAAKAAADAAAKAAAEANQNQPNQPVGQALNATVNIINTAVTTTKEGGAVPAVVAASTTTDKDESKAAEAVKEEKKDGIASKEIEIKKSEPVKKLYCN